MDYTSKSNIDNLMNNLPKELIELRNNYRENGIPTLLSESLNELIGLVYMKRPKRILELGTSVGCSGISMLLTCKDCTLVTVEKIYDVYKEAKQNYEKFGVLSRATLICGDSLDVTEKLDGPFDFIFLDCNKAAYLALYPYLKDMLPSGGILVADNILFRGYVEDISKCPKELRTLTEKIKNFNDVIMSDKDMISNVINIGDGMIVSVKK